MSLHIYLCTLADDSETPNFMKEMFNKKELKCAIRDSNLIYQLKFEKVAYGKNAFKYYVLFVYNLLLNEVKKTADI